uniref:Uncharacterized protein n=1 Tax=Sclerotinia sclerotiorum hypovirus 1-A TaxID=2231755 RepID=A0A2Z4QKC9_9VIRU|nr:hypothetical protein [Sclerotinia sclerotiorum hypovirus 1-A]
MNNPPSSSDKGHKPVAPTGGGARVHNVEHKVRESSPRSLISSGGEHDNKHARRSGRDEKPPSRPSSSRGEEITIAHRPAPLNLPSRPIERSRESSRHRGSSTESHQKAPRPGYCYAVMFEREHRHNVMEELKADPTLAELRAVAGGPRPKYSLKNIQIKITANIGLSKMGPLKPVSLHVERVHNHTGITPRTLIDNEAYATVRVGSSGYEEDDDEGWEDEDEGEDVTHAGDWDHYRDLQRNYPGLRVIPPTETPSPSPASGSSAESMWSPAFRNTWQAMAQDPFFVPNTMHFPSEMIEQRIQDFGAAAADALDAYNEGFYDELPDDYVEEEDWFEPNSTTTWGLPTDNRVACSMGAAMDVGVGSTKEESPLEAQINQVVNEVVDDVVESADAVFTAIAEVTSRQPNHSCDSSALVPRRVADCYTALATGYHPTVIASQSSTGFVAFVNGLTEVFKTIVVAADGFDASMRIHPGWHKVENSLHIVPGRINIGEVKTFLDASETLKGEFVIVITNFHYWTPGKSELAKDFEGKVIRVSPSPKQRSYGKKVVIRVPYNDTSCRFLMEPTYTCVIQAGRDGVFIFVSEENVMASYFWFVLQTAVFPSWVKRYGLVKHWDMSYPTPRMWRGCFCSVSFGLQEPGLQVTCYHVS